MSKLGSGQIRRLFDKYDPVRNSRIDKATGRDAAGFAARAGGVFHAQCQGFGEVCGVDYGAAGDDDHAREVTCGRIFRSRFRSLQ